MKNGIRILVIIIIASLIGIGSYYYINGWYNEIPWAIASLVIGYRSDTVRNSIINGVIFGYVLFLVYSYVGSAAKMDAGNYLRFILVDVLLSLIGAIVGAAGSFAGFWVKGNKKN